MKRSFVSKFMGVASLLLSVTGGSAVAYVEETEKAAPAPQVIYKVGEFVKERDVNGMRLSPSGKNLVFTMPREDQIILVFGEFEGTKFKVVANTAFPLNNYPVNVRWASNNRLLFTLRQKAKIRGSKYYAWVETLAAMNKDGSDLAILRTDGGSKSSFKHIENADVISMLRDEPEHILVGKSRRRNWVDELYTGALDDVYKLNIHSGEMSLYMKGPKIKRFKFHDWYADHKGHIRLGYGYDRKGNSVMIIRGRGDDDWKVLSDNELFEEGKFRPLMFGAGENEFYVLSSLATGRMAVYRFNIDTGTLGDLVFQHDRVDAGNIIYSYDQEKVVAATFDENGSKIAYLDEAYGKMRGRINDALETGISLWSVSDDDKRMIILAGDERDEGSFYLFTRQKGSLTFLGGRNLGLDAGQLAEMDSVFYDSRDGLTINAVLTKPREHTSGALPFIVLPHSNPGGMDSVEWDRTVQFLANRGYGVFQPNYRGSFGFGQRFRNLGRGEWGRDMQNDLVDGVEWLIDEGHAEEGKICIIGRGYAGYAALLAVAREARLFSCAAARDAPVDVRAMLRDQDALDDEHEEYLKVAGDLEKNRLSEISPVTYVAGIQAPVLIYHREDSYYDIKHTRKFVKSLSKAKKTFDYLELEEVQGADLYDATLDHKQFLSVVENWLLKVNPTPMLQAAAEAGKVADAPKMTKSN